MSARERTESGVVVVGVDGSEASKDALGWAVRFARAAGMVVHAITAWHYPASYGWAPAPALPGMDMESDARQMLKEAVERVVLAEGPVKVRTEVAKGPPALMLVKAARNADLLVVGSRGLGAFTGMLLGSVSEHCVHHATCPVVVVHHPHGTAEESG